METYHGHVRTPADAIILFEACRIGLLPRVQRRLSEKERQSIRSGSIFVWDEREAGMRRWTDGKSWSASRVSGSFLTYREMEGKRGGSGLSTPLFSGNASKVGKDSAKTGDQDSNDDGPDGYRYKPDGLMKQSFSITTSSGQHLHLISYYSRTAAASHNLMQPSNDPQLRLIRPERGMYPESTVHDHSSIPPVTQGPMGGAGYAPVTAHAMPTAQSSYGRAAPSGPPGPYPGFTAPAWAPPSPMNTPPPHYPQYYGASHPPYAQTYAHSPHQHHTAGHSPYSQHNTPASTPLDRAPANTSAPTLPPPPSSYPSHPEQPYHHSLPPTSAPYSHPAAPVPAPAPGSLAQPVKHEPHAYHSALNGATYPAHKDIGPRHDSLNPRPSELPQPRKSLTPVVTLPPPTSSSATTIPSITSLINGAQAAIDEQNRRSGSISPGSQALPDITLHKSGFNHHSDVRALRDLDRATFRA